MTDSSEQAAEQYSKYVNLDIEKRLIPISNSIDAMLARLEEFETIVNFARQEQTYANEALNSLQEHQGKINDLFERIDALEALVKHAKSSVSHVEAQVEKAEEMLGCSESKTNKVANIFTPLFKRTTPERKENCSDNSKPFNSSDYFR